MRFERVGESKVALVRFGGRFGHVFFGNQSTWKSEPILVLILSSAFPRQRIALSPLHIEDETIFQL